MRKSQPRVTFNKPVTQRMFEGKYSAPVPDAPAQRQVPYGQDATYGTTDGPRARQERSTNLAGEAPTVSPSDQMWQECQPPHEEGRYAQMIREEAAAKAKENARIEKERVAECRRISDLRLKEEKEKHDAVLIKQAAARAQWQAELLLENVKFQELVTD